MKELKYSERSLGEVVLLKKRKIKVKKMDGKEIKIVFPKGEYKVDGVYDDGNDKVVKLTLNPSLDRYMSYGQVFNLDVKPEDIIVLGKTCKSRLKLKKD